tara:strand:- start:80 stop:337 length:258 start_codon:yes stop_codon:yes gene_type:complete
MSNLLLKTQQELHKNTTKWNQVIHLVKEISIKHYEQDEFRVIVDEIVKAVFSNDEEKKEKENTWAKEIDTSDMKDWDKPNESEIL